MTFDQWSALMEVRLKQRFPEMSVLDRNPGICYALGVASLDMIELVAQRVRVVPRKDALVVQDGRVMGRHKGMVLEPVEFALRDDEFSRALLYIRRHFQPERSPWDDRDEP